MELVKERPILFSAAMIQAILSGRKTQTRRAMNPQPTLECILTEGILPPTPSSKAIATQNRQGGWEFSWPDSTGHFLSKKCPYGKVGDRLWVRETWWQVPEPSLREQREGADTWPKPIGPQEQRVAYAADGDDPDTVRGWGWKLRPSIFMPRWASRITLQITDIRAMRLQEIAPADAKCEGDKERSGFPEFYSRGEFCHVDWFHQLWDSINVKRGFGWDVNPWVWAVTFQRVDGGAL